MAHRFSNFEDDDPSPLRSTPNNKTDSDPPSSSSTGRYTSSKKFREATATDASFDDFDADWESDLSTASPRPYSPTQPSALGTKSSHLRNSTQSTARGPNSSSQDTSTTLELSSPSDLDKRALSLDENDAFDRTEATGPRRVANYTGTTSRNSAGMTLNTFSSSDHSINESEHYQPHASSSDYNNHYNRSNGDRETNYDSTMPPMPQVQYEPFSVEPPSHYQNYLYLLKYIHGLKILAGLHLLYTAIALFFKVWYLLGGIIVAPFGFFAVHKLDRRLVLVWGVLFFADTLAEAIGALVNSGKSVEQGGGIAVTITHMSIVVLRLGFTYLIYRFWTKLPENAAEYFALFTSTPERTDAV